MKTGKIMSGWPVKTLGEIAVIERKGIGPEEIKSGTHYVGLEHLDSDGGFTDIPIVQKGDLASTKFAFKEEHVLYGKLRPYLRKVSRPNFSGVCSTDILPIRPNKQLDKDYLYHYLRQQEVTELASTRSSGANLPRISPKVLETFPIPLPPLSEQKRIAAILDKADAIRKKRQKAIDLTETFLQSAFLEMFGDPVRNPKGWEVKPIGEMLQSIDSGWSPKCEDHPALDGEWGILKLGAVTTCNYLPQDNKALKEGQSPKPNIEVKSGDILFSRKNTYELVGATAYVHETPKKLMLPDLIFRLKIKARAQLESSYLWQLLIHKGMRSKIQQLASGSAGSMPNISKSRLKTLQIQIPPQEKQKEFHELVISYRKTQIVHETIAISESELFSSLLQKAFRGGL